jgi:hypothetical protein
MNSPIVRRFALPVPALAFVLATLLAPAASRAADDPSKAPPPPIKVAVLPIINASQDLSAVKIMEDIVREQLRTVPPSRATFLLPIDTDRILTQRGAMDRSLRLSDRWDKYGVLDSTAVAGFDSLVMADAILFVKVTEWENHRVTVIGAGQSHTTIGLALACYDIRSKKRIWYKNPREQRFGQEIDPSSGSVAYDDTGFIQSKRTSDPPRFEDVAADLLRDAMKKFPGK